MDYLCPGFVCKENRVNVKRGKLQRREICERRQREGSRGQAKRLEALGLGLFLICCVLSILRSHCLIMKWMFQ